MMRTTHRSKQIGCSYILHTYSTDMEPNRPHAADPAPSEPGGEAYISSTVDFFLITAVMSLLAVAAVVIMFP